MKLKKHLFYSSQFIVGLSTCLVAHTQAAVVATNNDNLNGGFTSRFTLATRELEFEIPAGPSYVLDSLGININSLGNLGGTGLPSTAGEVSIYSGGYTTGMTSVGGPVNLNAATGLQTATFSGVTLAPGVYRIAWTPSVSTIASPTDTTSALTADSDAGNDIQNPFVLAAQGASNNGPAGESPIAVVINATIAVPEPSSTLLLGIAGLGFISRRKR